MVPIWMSIFSHWESDSYNDFFTSKEFDWGISQNLVPREK